MRYQVQRPRKGPFHGSYEAVYVLHRQSFGIQVEGVAWFYLSKQLLEAKDMINIDFQSINGSKEWISSAVEDAKMCQGSRSLLQMRHIG